MTIDCRRPGTAHKMAADGVTCIRCHTVFGQQTAPPHPGRHREDRFPKAEDPYACSACRGGSHEGCSLAHEIPMSPGGDAYRCECYRTAAGAHDDLQPKTLTAGDEIGAALNTALGSTIHTHALIGRRLAELGYSLVTPRRSSR